MNKIIAAIIAILAVSLVVAAFVMCMLVIINVFQHSSTTYLAYIPISIFMCCGGVFLCRWLEKHT